MRIDVPCVTFKAASQLLACSLSTTYQMAAQGKFGPIIRNSYPRRIRLDAIRALAGPPSPQQLTEAQRGARTPRKRKVRHG